MWTESPCNRRSWSRSAPSAQRPALLTSRPFLLRSCPRPSASRSEDLPQAAHVLYSTRAGLTQARSASDGTVPSLALRACVRPTRVEYNGPLIASRSKTQTVLLQALCLL